MRELIAQMRMEWRLQWSRPFVWFCLLASLGLAFAMTLENAYGMHGYSWVNGGDAIATRALILSVLGIIIAAGVVGEAMSRDKVSGTEETILVSGVGKAQFGLGRFVVAFAVVLLISCMFIPGMIAGTLVPGIPEERLGPLVVDHYLKAMAIYIVPNFLLMSSLIYAIAARWRSQTAAFIVALGLIALYVTALMLLGKDVYRHDVFSLYAMLDPYGNIASAEHSMTWTVAQNNTQFRPLADMLLNNRLLWLGISIILIVIGTWGIPLYLQQPKQTVASKMRRKRFAGRYFGSGFNGQLALMTAWEIKTLWRQPGVLLLLGFAAFSLWWAAASAVTYAFSLPTTDLLVHNAGFYFDKILILLLVWYAADIVWREQQYHVDELIDALPSNDTWRFLAKTLALLLIVLVFWILSIAVNIGYQISQGFYDFELWLYFTDTFLFKAPYYLWMAILAMAMQVIVRQRYIAMALVLLIYLSGPLFDALYLFHPLYRFGEVPFFWYSLMDGYGHFWQGHLWFLLYWSVVCLVLWLIAWGCYARGSEPLPRIQLWHQRLFQGKGRHAFCTALLAAVAVGAVIAYQSMVLHRWPLLKENAYMAMVEKQYRAEWGDYPQPKITAIKGDIEIYPEQRKIEMQGSILVQNQSSQQIEELLVFFHPHLKRVELKLQAIADVDRERSYPHVQVWRLKKPLAPNAAIQLPFHTASFPDAGFAAHNPSDEIPEVHPVEVIGNGTSLLNLNLIPALGYSERLEHKPTWRRREYGLQTEWSPPKSTIGPGVAHDTTHLSWVQLVDVTVSTSADQIPLHMGKIVEDCGIVDGRRKIRYRTDHPSRGWSEIMSGNYQVYRQQREGLPAVELYYHPAHDYALEPIAENLLDAMAYFQTRYGEPPFDTFRMAEASLHYNGFGARGGLAFVSEVLGWKTDLSRSQGEDLRKFAANLMGMGWWLDQVMPGNVPGAKTILSGLPYWTSALYLHQSRGPELSRRLRLQDMMETYRARAGLEDKEQPFIVEMKDSAMIRNKGALHIVYLAELVGQERLEAALASFLQTWRFKPAPYPAAEDLVQHLKVELPLSAHPQIDDMFKSVSNWRLRVVEAQAWREGDSQWQLRAVVEASKWYTTGLGVEQEVDLDTPMQLAAFSGEGFDESDIIQKQWRPLKGGRSEILLQLDEKPTRFGIDPYLFLPDANPYDNVIEVEMVQIENKMATLAR